MKPALMETVNNNQTRHIEESGTYTGYYYCLCVCTHTHTHWRMHVLAELIIQALLFACVPCVDACSMLCAVCVCTKEINEQSSMCLDDLVMNCASWSTPAVTTAQENTLRIGDYSMCAKHMSEERREGEKGSAQERATYSKKELNVRLKLTFIVVSY